MVAWTLRALKLRDDALRLLQNLDAESADAPDGFVFEELGQNYSALGRHAEARPQFVKAWDLLSRDHSSARPAEARLERLRRLGCR